MGQHGKYLIDAFLDETLAPDQWQAFERHVRRCRGCAQAVRDASSARAFLRCLVPKEAVALPRPGFYNRVQDSIERRLAAGWAPNLIATLRPKLAYLLVLIGLLLGAWTSTLHPQEGEEGLMAMEFSFTPFISLSLSASDRSQGRDLVMMSLVGAPEQGVGMETAEVP